MAGIKTRTFNDLKPGDLVILHTDDSRYPDEEKFIKSIGSKWIKLEFDYPGVKYSVIDGQANDKMPGYRILIPKTPLQEEWYSIFHYLLEDILPKYLETLPLSKLKHLEKRWVKKLNNNHENNPTI